MKRWFMWTLKTIGLWVFIMIVTYFIPISVALYFHSLLMLIFLWGMPLVGILMHIVDPMFKWGKPFRAALSSRIVGVFLATVLIIVYGIIVYGDPWENIWYFSLPFLVYLVVLLIVLAFRWLPTLDKKTTENKDPRM